MELTVEDKLFAIYTHPLVIEKAVMRIKSNMNQCIIIKIKARFRTMFYQKKGIYSYDRIYTSKTWQYHLLISK